MTILCFRSSCSIPPEYRSRCRVLSVFLFNSPPRDRNLTGTTRRPAIMCVELEEQMSGRIKGLFIGLVGFMLGAVLTPFVHGQGGKLEGNLTHIGFAVRDADKAAKEFAELFGVEVPAPLMLRDVPYLPSSGGSFQKMSVKVIGL